MSGVIDLSGTIFAGPPNVTDTTFPNMRDTVDLHTTPTQRQYAVCTGALSRTIASTGAYVTLGGIGPTDTVTKADFLYLRCNGTLRIRMTQVDGLGTLVSEQDVGGLLVLEKPSAGCITLLEVKGSATVEYLAAGQQ